MPRPGIEPAISSPTPNQLSYIVLYNPRAVINFEAYENIQFFLNIHRADHMLM